MKVNYLIIIILLASIGSQAQMFVSPSSYVFVNNEQVYVAKEINLNGTGAIYLRKEGQLLQGSTTGGANVGTGALSVFQEGTSNNFGYNYWCSPVGGSDVTAGNSNFGITQLHRPTTVTASAAATILPSGNLNGVSTNTSLSIAPYWIFKYIASNIYTPGAPSGWASVGSASTVNPGLGFTMKGVSGSDNVVAHPISGTLGDGIINNVGNKQRYDFRGKPNDGTISIGVGAVAGADYANSTLTGNPYPSAINLNLFLLENSGFTINYATGIANSGGPAAVINGRALFWEQRKNAASHNIASYEGGYGVYTATGPTVASPGTYVSATWNTYNGDGTPNTTGASSGVAYKRMFVPVGQGFMIQGVVSGNAQMKNLYRSFVKEGVLSNSEFERNSNATSNTNWDEIQNVAGIDYTKFSKLPAPQFKLHTVVNNQYTKESAIVFNDNTTDGFDLGLDAVSADNFAKDAYFPLTENDKFVITVMPFDMDKRIPLAFTTDGQSSFKISVSELINFTLSDEIYLYDNVNNTYYDIKNGAFDITLAAGTYKNRFEITFKNSDVVLSQQTMALGSEFSVHQNNTTNNLTVLNPKLYDVTAITIYDVTGKSVISKSNIGNPAQYELSTSNFSDGVYIVSLSTKNNLTVNKKVLIKRN